mgnify:CR=1
MTSSELTKLLQYLLMNTFLVVVSTPDLSSAHRIFKRHELSGPLVR